MVTAAAETQTADLMLDAINLHIRNFKTTALTNFKRGVL